MDQWRSKSSESFSLDRYWFIECSSQSLPSTQNQNPNSLAGLSSIAWFAAERWRNLTSWPQEAGEWQVAALHTWIASGQGHENRLGCFDDFNERDKLMK